MLLRLFYCIVFHYILPSLIIAIVLVKSSYPLSPYKLVGSLFIESLNGLYVFFC